MESDASINPAAADGNDYDNDADNGNVNEEHGKNGDDSDGDINNNNDDDDDDDNNDDYNNKQYFKSFSKVSFT